MKTIKLQQLKLTNFKGVRSLELNNLSEETSIYGDNGVGKTTIFDAFTWLLFGKDSNSRTVFELKTLDANNNVIPKLDHEVEATLLIGSETITLRKILREKWVTKRGSIESEFSGNDTTYEWNGVPMNARDYAAKINNLVNEDVFKMITSPLAFNSLSWKDQRDALINLSGNITNEEIAKGFPEFETLLTKLVGKSFDEYKTEITASRLKSIKELKTIPTRIDEVERSKPDPLDFNGLKVVLETKTKQAKEISDQIADKLNASQSDIDNQQDIQKEIFAIETEINNVRNGLKQESALKHIASLSKPREIKGAMQAIDYDIKSNDELIARSNNQIGVYGAQIKKITKELAELRIEWSKESAKHFEFDENENACSTCLRKFEAELVEDKRKDLEEHFNTTKIARINAIDKKGQSLNTEKEAYEKNVNDIKENIVLVEQKNKSNWENRADLSEELESIPVKSQDEIYGELIKEKASYFTTKTNEVNFKKDTLKNRPKVDVSELETKRDALIIDCKNIEAQLIKELQIIAADARIVNLSNEESTLAQGIANIEKELFVIESFEKEKSTRIEDSVNNRFQIVKFKLFETQINGGEKPTCKALVNGVPFSDLNTASKINAGIDIINTLCNHYQVNAPIFIDNRESVVELINTNSQIVNLIVSENDKKLRVVTMAENLETV